MKAQLVKRKNRWDLYAEDGSKSASTAPNPIGKLSIKNCQDIENGYDLEELAEEFAYYQSNEDSNEKFAKFAFKQGFQKAMELMEGKKFTYNDVQRAFIQGVYTKNQIHGKKEEYMESLQPTEWEVEIEMGTLCRQIDCVDNATLVKSKIVWDKEEPILDKGGCLILRKYDK